MRAEGLKPPHGTEWTGDKVKDGVGVVAKELFRRLRLDDEAGYRELAAKFRGVGA